MKHLQDEIMQHIAIIGLGQIGGSIARKLTNNGVQVKGFDSDLSTMNAASSIGIPLTKNLESAIENASIVFISVSLGANRNILSRIINLTENLSSKPIITDVASYKYGTGGELQKYNNILLGHPMAGTHGHGFSSSDPELFEKAQWPIILNDDFDCINVITLLKVITGLGAKVPLCSIDWHDKAVSLVSALPHAMAIVLGYETSKIADFEEKIILAAGSYKSGTRVLLSESNFLRDLIWYNRPTLMSILRETITSLNYLSEVLERGEFSTFEKIISDAKNVSEFIYHHETHETIVEKKHEEISEFMKLLKNTGGSILRVDTKLNSVVFYIENASKVGMEYLSY